MPPKGGKQSPEEKEKAFLVFKETDEYKQYFAIQAAKDADVEIQKSENSTTDICSDWQKFLDTLYHFKSTFKIPGKSKSYDQKVVRTMFFERLKDNALELKFDGVWYPCTTATSLDHWNCRSFLMQEMYPKIERAEMDDLISAQTFATYKKEFAKMMKDWDKKYLAHQKKAHVEILDIQVKVAMPLTNLFESNFNFFCLNRLIDKGENCPDFRYKALEDKFIEHLTRVCDLMRDYASLNLTLQPEQHLVQYYDIRQMLAVLKTENWRNIVPFNYYFKPLREKLDDVIACLNAMRKAGPLRHRYICENNNELLEKLVAMAKCDTTMQWVGADALKRDQLNFFYTVMKRMFDSPLRAILVDETKNKDLLANVWPNYLAYHANLRHCIIDTKKEKDRLHRRTKRVRAGLDPDSPIEEPEPEEEFKKHVPVKPTNKKIEVVEELPPRPTDEDEKTMKEYGRYFMMRNYFEENEEHMLMWQEGSVRIGRINDSVLTDLDDYLQLQAFKGMKPTDIRVKCDEYLEIQRARQVMHLKKAKEEGNPLEEGKIQDRKRDFMRHFRPDMKHPVWNFCQEDHAKGECPHVLRENADPREPYRDDCELRVDKTLINIQALAAHLCSYEKENWDLLTKYVVQIFIDQEKAEAAEYAAWEEHQ